MTTVYDVPTSELINTAAAKLKEGGKITPPEWSDYVKTGRHREKAPVDEDWWYVRSAAVLRKIYLKGPIGVERLRAEFGGPADRGSKPNKACKGSGAIIRAIVQQLEDLSLVRKEKTIGRVISPKGQSLLDNAAYDVKEKLKGEHPFLEKY